MNDPPKRVRFKLRILHPPCLQGVLQLWLCFHTYLTYSQSPSVRRETGYSTHSKKCPSAHRNPQRVRPRERRFGRSSSVGISAKWWAPIGVQAFSNLRLCLEDALCASRHPTHPTPQILALRKFTQDHDNH